MTSRLAPVVVLALAICVSGAGCKLPEAPNCPVLPASNVWNQEIASLPVAGNSGAMIAAIGSTSPVHPDFGSNLEYGIPYNVVSGTQPRQRVTFDYDDESDAGPYPIPDNPKIEGGGDAHLITVDRDNCRLYELFAVRRTADGWAAGSGAIWDLRSNALRPDGWTSADAAGLPILPGLVRHDEVAGGVIDHALRFTARRTRNTHVYPARHHAGTDDPALPPMGMRVRLKASFDTSGFSRDTRVILTALKRYGMLLADNGSPWFISGVSNPDFDDDAMHELGRVQGADFEVVDTSSLPRGPGG
ncbi:MAG TPA: hypothetical protein VEQ61_05935 [Thermoleophilaceae bacterium]|nr:hypothetical protein [Thermoleophilaceae bacterium]